LYITSDSQYAINAITHHADKWIDMGFTNIGNADVLRALYAELKHARARIYLRKVKGHSNDEGNDGADLEANRGANKDTPDIIDISTGSQIKKLGAAARSITQATAYQHIRNIKHKTERRRTHLMVEMTKATIMEASGIEPTAQAIWRSLQKRKGTALSLKFAAFAWRGLHDSHKVGKFWEHITAVRDTHMPCRSCGVPEESMSHILTECSVSGQETIWKLARKAWEHTNLDFPNITLGLILGIGTLQIKDTDGKVLDGRTRLIQILVSESAYLAWLIRCEYRIGRGEDESQKHTTQEIEARWLTTLSRRLRLDWAMTNTLTFGRKALRKSVFKRTWSDIASRKSRTSLRSDIVGRGVLVGRTANRRPPGRNR
ncbi:hypothetical protein DFP72DRAFT_807262, partial [Ephemerocybe angulata]